jgi:alkylhydroperoxidase/carboxymuconolactone decarboxylase family protein YurZ
MKKKKTKSSKVPTHYSKFLKNYPEVAKSYTDLSNAVKKVGTLNPKMRALIKLGIAVGLKHEGAVHSHTRKSLEAGATPEEIRQAVILSLTTIGFPSMMAALSWVNDVLERR